MIVKDAKFLKQTCEDIESVEEAEEIIQKLTAELEKNKNGIGLSAIQIGILKNVSVIKRDGFKDIHLINATLKESNRPFVFMGEGCLSFPGVYVNTTRFQDYIINNHVIKDGKFVSKEEYYFYSSETEEMGNMGIAAIAVQHELDHCSGVLFFSREVIQQVKTAVSDKKAGRNDPCPCGKTKDDGTPVKHKKCCMA
tara:strand:- start:23732 stop:24319 length:588 start_codon:yes stop_codon:yes gene_type:complete